MEENTKEKVEQSIDELIHAKGPLDMAQDYISMGRFDGAQNILDSVEEKSGKKYYLQSIIYKEKKWYNEQLKQLKKAVKADPDNEEYRKELEELKAFSKTPEYKSAVMENQMGAGDVCAAGCCEGSVYCCCTGLCEGICNGC